MTDLSAVESIFHAALERPTPEARASYLDAACPNPEVRRQVERLLAAHPQVGDFLKPSDGELTEDHVSIQERPGMVIGPYKLMEQIGEGGMGLVFVAEQQHAVRRKVALKIIKPGMDSRDVIARFEAERQALALMDHPNIARVFDAGTTAERPAVLRHGAGQGHSDRRVLRRPAAHDPGAARPVPLGLPGGPARPRQGDHPPRPEAVEHPGRAPRRRARGQGDRLRRGEGDRPAAHRQDDLHPVRPDDRHAART